MQTNGDTPNNQISQRAISILMVEDSPFDFELVLRELRRGSRPVDATRVDTEIAYTEALKKMPDIVLCDYNLPQFNAMLALEIARAHDPYLPFIIVSGSVGEDIAVSALIAGANDYVMKDRLERLGQAVQRALEWRALRKEMNMAHEAAFLRGRAMEAVSQGIMICSALDPELPILYVNSAFTKITGYTADEVLGKSSRFLQGAETDANVLENLRQAIHRFESVHVEILNYKKDGAAFWNQLAISPIYDSNGVVTHFVGVQTDVTERKLLEAQFIQSQKMDAIGRLAGGIAHDFNNILSAIMGYCELAMMQSEPDAVIRKDLDEVLHASKRAAGLTQQLLTFSKRQLVLPQLIDVNNAIRELEKMLRRIIGEDILFETQLSDNLPPIRIDPGQFGQVILNLAVNARDAMPDGGHLVIRTMQGEPDEHGVSYVVIEVSDTGHGMGEEILAHIFEPFFTTKADGRGTGLGLSTVYGIVTQAAGHIAVQSTPHEGSTFHIRIPADTSGIENDAISQRVTFDDSGTENILIVDDEISLVTMITRVLTSKGYNIYATHDPEMAMKIAREKGDQLHLLISDMVMPGMNGRQLAEYIQQETGLSTVLFMTGYTDERVIKDSVLFASAPVLRKPFTPTELTQTVRKILDARAPSA